MRKPDMNETTAGIKIRGQTINNLRYADDITLLAETMNGRKRLQIKVKAESAAAGLKLNLKKIFVTIN